LEFLSQNLIPSLFLTQSLYHPRSLWAHQQVAFLLAGLEEISSALAVVQEDMAVVSF
jgi:hypothetical protein